MPVTSGEIFDGIAAVATLGAAFAAAISAYISSKTAEVAKEAVKEAQLARRAELAPRLVLDRNFSSFYFRWPDPNERSGGPALLARMQGRDESPLPPTFSLTNYGGGPALELEIVFEIEDQNGCLEVPESLKSHGLSIENYPSSNVQPEFKVLNYLGRDGSGVGLPLYKRSTTDIVNCAPGQTRTIDFPMPLLNRIFLRGLQFWSRGQGTEGGDYLVLSIQISCHTVEGEEFFFKFRFFAAPFFYGQLDPMLVTGHFWELPVYPKSGTPRVM